MWPLILIIALGTWLFIAVILGIVMWQRESAVQDAVLYLLGGIGGGSVMILALFAELTAEKTSDFQIAFIVAGIIIFAAATISGLRQLNALYKKNKHS